MEQIIEVKIPTSAKRQRYKTTANVKPGSFVVVENDGVLFCAEIVKISPASDQTATPIVRVATKADLQKAKDCKAKAVAMIAKTKELIKKNNLSMKIFDADFTLDEKKLIVFFTADGRVDFRELVKDMAAAFKKRIELHQVGSRDQVQKMGSVGICGRECCCHKHLMDFNHVSIKMAKQQGLSLMPNNISGACGKLLCCLEYENSEYAKIFKDMPEVNSSINTPNGTGKVVFNNLIKKEVHVKIGDEISTFPLDVIMALNKKGKHE